MSHDIRRTNTHYKVRDMLSRIVDSPFYIEQNFILISPSHLSLTSIAVIINGVWYTQYEILGAQIEYCVVVPSWP